MTQIWEMVCFKLVSQLNHIELLHPLTQKKIQIFHVFDNVYVEDLNVVMSSSGQAQVDEDDDSNDIIDINVEDCDGADDESIEKEEDNSN